MIFDESYGIPVDLKFKRNCPACCCIFIRLFFCWSFRLDSKRVFNLIYGLRTIKYHRNDLNSTYPNHVRFSRIYQNKKKSFKPVRLYALILCVQTEFSFVKDYKKTIIITCQNQKTISNYTKYFDFDI